MRTRRVVTVVLSVVVALLGSLVVIPAAEASSAGAMVSYINAARGAAGLAPYAVRSDLAAVAQAQAQRMAAANELYHNPNLATDVKNYSWVGENVGYGPSLATVHQAFMNSAPHRANILSTKFTEVGVGVVTKNGVVWIAEVFRRPLSVSGTATVRSSAPSKPATTTRTVSKPVQKPAAAPAKKPAAAVAKPKAPVKPAAAKKPTVPQTRDPGWVCSAAPDVAVAITQLMNEERSVWQVQQLQRMVTGFQCGRSLPMSGVLDSATVRALKQVS